MPGDGDPGLGGHPLGRGLVPGHGQPLRKAAGDPQHVDGEVDVGPGLLPAAGPGAVDEGEYVIAEPVLAEGGAGGVPAGQGQADLRT